MSAGKPTLGVAFSIWNTSLMSAAYSALAGLTDITPPDLVGEKAVDVTSHDSAVATLTDSSYSNAQAVREAISSGLLKWTDCTGEFNSIPDDPAQVYLLAAVGTIQKFKIVKAATGGTILFNALIEEVPNQGQPLVGKQSYKFKLTPTGVPPNS